MQGSKLPGARLWIAGVSTALILIGCEAQPVKEQAANTNQSTYPAKSKAESTAELSAGVAPSPAREAKVVTDQSQLAGAAVAQPQTAPAAPAAEINQNAQSGALMGAFSSADL